MSETATDEFLTVRQLADRYGVHITTVYAWNRKGDGPRVLEIGGELRYRLSDVLAWEESRARGGIA